MAFVEINPLYHAKLSQHGLVEARDFLETIGVICCGHLDRNVARVTMGKGSDALPAFLKREHRMHWRDRLASTCAGFGWKSRSRREFAILQQLRAAGIGVPEPLACGEDEQGRAFLLIRDLVGYRDLRHVLAQEMEPQKRRQVARQLGEALAQVHQAGFQHSDLYSKHVLLLDEASPMQPAVCFLDWQRARRRLHVNWALRWRDLAALNATLAEELATPRQRVQALRAYLRACQRSSDGRPGLSLRQAATEIRKVSRLLLERRRIREMRQPPLPTGMQNLIWLDGEALQVTREFRDELRGQVPDWLNAKEVVGAYAVKRVRLPGSRSALLITRSANRPLRWLWNRLWRRPQVAPELKSMKVLLRLQRYGVVGPRLLAAGQQRPRPWQMKSFLLTEPPSDAVPLLQFLRQASPPVRRECIGSTARFLRQLHKANCYLDATARESMADLLIVCSPRIDNFTVGLGTVHTVEQCAYPNPVRAMRDLATMWQSLDCVCSQSDLLFGLLTYFGQRHLTFQAKKIVRTLLRRKNEPRRPRRFVA
jgi:tRNA A-37 threonylcarbamoyl transferase component Bud32